jgi:O-antigen/teichoic acid export membrane protein
MTGTAKGRRPAREDDGQSWDMPTRPVSRRADEVRRPRVPDPGPRHSQDRFARSSAEEEWRRSQLEGIQALLELSVPVMANSSVTAPIPLFRDDKQGRSRSLLKDRAVRGALSLMLSAGATGGLGYVFWAFTAHHMNAAAVGKISAEVSSITFLATIGSLNLTGIFGRFLPEAGWRARKLLVTGYGSATLVGLLASLVYLATPMAKGLAIGGGVGALAFVISVVLNSIFNIQDGGLIGFGRFEWIPVENASVALARFALLPVAAIFLSAQASVLGAWLLPMAVAILVVNIYSLGPLAGEKMRQRPKLPKAGELSHLIAVGAISGSVNAVVSAFLPAVVTHRLGSAQGGYFYVPWMITSIASLLMINVTTSMTREIIANSHRGGTVIRRSLSLAGLMVAAIMIGCLLLAGLLLAPLGHNFVTYGTPLVRWVGLAMPATAVIVFFWALCAIRRRPWPAFGINLFTAVAIFGGVLLLRPGSDIGRVGMIYCAVQWTSALVVVFPTFAGLRAIARRTDSRRQLYGSFREHGSHAGPGRWPPGRRAGRTAGRGGG